MGGVISATAARLFEQCPLAFDMRFGRGWPQVPVHKGDDSSIRVGFAVHAVISDLARLRFKDPSLPTVPSAAELGQQLLLVTAHHLTSTEECERAAKALEGARELLALGPLLAPPEYGFGLPLAPDVQATGRFDLVREGSRGSVVITDWKLSGNPDDEWEDDVATGIYLAAGRALWPGARVGVEYVFLEQGRTMFVPWTERQEIFARTRLLSAFRANDAGYKAARVGGHCGDCVYRTACRPYQSYARVLAHRAPEAPENLADDDLLNAHVAANDAEKIAKAAKSDLVKVVRKRMANAEKWTAGEHKATLVTQSVKDVDPEVLAYLASLGKPGLDIGSLLRNCADVSSRALEGLLEQLTDEERAQAMSYVRRTARDYVRVS